ncbi:pantoate--beta-alanine ligase [Peptococcaceae bacterium]|nr:pantoate--beta-alanine ligase [Peptococcaceae bacterium]
MLILKTVAEVKNFIKNVKETDKTIGFVPTMGYFHKGHLALMKCSKEQCDVTVVSIYVNPMQFGANEDFKSYPKELERDAELAEQAGVDVLFVPEDKEIYPEGFNTKVEVGEDLTKKLCGIRRPGHFTGVTTVVLKLFNIVKPDYAYFGEKDIQQLLVIKRMVRDLNLDVEIVPVKTTREADGLAMSSRNAYLNPDERKAAAVLYRSLLKAKKAWEEGERSAEKLCDIARDELLCEPLAKVEYVEIYSYPDLKPLDEVKGAAVLALAVRIGKARLIDNVTLGVEK